MATVVAVADLHGSLPDELPGGDVLVIAGDVCPLEDHSPAFQRRWLETDLYPWLDRLPHADVIWIAGNHDFACEEEGWDPGGRGTYLLDSGTTAAGLTFWGTPWIPKLKRWAFYAGDSDRAERFAAIGAVDVLVSHGPPLGHGDRLVGGEHAGCPHLAAAIERTAPQLCVCGHIHEDHGTSQIGPTTVANAAWVDELYAVRPGAAMSFEIEPGRS